MKKIILALLVCLSAHTYTHAQSKLAEVLKRFDNKVLYPKKKYPCVFKATFDANGEVTINIDPSHNKDKTPEYERIEKYAKIYSIKYKKVNDYMYAGYNDYENISLMYFDGMFYFASTSNSERYCANADIIKDFKYNTEKYDEISKKYEEVYAPLLKNVVQSNGKIVPNSIKNRKLKGFYVKLSNKPNEKAFAVGDEKDDVFYTVNTKDEEGTIPLDEFIVAKVSNSCDEALSGTIVYKAYPVGYEQLTKFYTLNAPANTYKDDFTKNKSKSAKGYTGSTDLLNSRTGIAANGADGGQGDLGRTGEDVSLYVSAFTNPANNEKCLLLRLNEECYLVPLNKTFTINVNGGDGGDGGDGQKGLEEGEYNRTGYTSKIKTKGSDKSGNAGNGSSGGRGGDVRIFYDNSVAQYLKNIIINNNGGRGGDAGNASSAFAGVAAGTPAKSGIKGRNGEVTKTAQSINTKPLTINLDNFQEAKKTATAVILPENKKYVPIDASILKVSENVSQSGTALKFSSLGTIQPFVVKEPIQAICDLGDSKFAFISSNQYSWGIYDAKSKQFNKSDYLIPKIESIYKTPTNKWAISRKDEYTQKPGNSFYLSADLKGFKLDEKYGTESYAANLYGEYGKFLEMPAGNKTDADAICFKSLENEDNPRNTSIMINFLKKNGNKFDFDKSVWLGDSNGNIFRYGESRMKLDEVKHWKENYFVLFTTNDPLDDKKPDNKGIYLVKVEKTPKPNCLVMSGIEIEEDPYGSTSYILNTSNNTATIVYTTSRDYSISYFTLPLSTVQSKVTSVSPSPSNVFDRESKVSSKFEQYKNGFVGVINMTGTKMALVTFDAKGKMTNTVTFNEKDEDLSKQKYRITAPSKDGKVFIFNSNTNDLNVNITEVNGL